MKRIHVLEPGGPQAMTMADVPVPTPGPGQALVKLAASGVNFIDVYFRTGLYKAESPITLGSEGAGTVERRAYGVGTMRSQGRGGGATPSATPASTSWRCVATRPSLTSMKNTATGAW